MSVAGKRRPDCYHQTKGKGLRMFNQKRVGIMGTGKIAGVMAGTIKKMKNVKCYGVASRSEERAKKFAEEYGIKVAYTSYEEMMLDDKIDLVYIATPHSEHYANMKLCIENGKNVLCEKSFTANAPQAEEVLSLAREKGVFVAEAIKDEIHADDDDDKGYY